MSFVEFYGRITKGGRISYPKKIRENLSKKKGAFVRVMLVAEEEEEVSSRLVEFIKKAREEVEEGKYVTLEDYVEK